MLNFLSEQYLIQSYNITNGCLALQHYEHLMLPVWMMNSKESNEFGVAQYCVPAVMYIAQQEWIAKGRHRNTLQNRITHVFMALL